MFFSNFSGILHSRKLFCQTCQELVIKLAVITTVETEIDINKRFSYLSCQVSVKFLRSVEGGCKKYLTFPTVFSELNVYLCLLLKIYREI